MLLTALLLAALAQQPAPQPFPRPGPSRPSPQTPPPSTQAAKPATAAPDAAPSEAALGVILYPGSQFLASYDAGRGQRFYLFGTTGSFVEVVTYYRTLLKQRGDVIMDAPATHEFDLGRFREDTMAFPPSVTVKEFQSQTSQGYPNPRPGGQPSRFPTVIQIIPIAQER